MSPYHVNQSVTAVVEQVYPFGVFLRLDDGTRAYIRRRELDLNADVDPMFCVQPGQTIATVIIGINDSDKGLELSRRLTMADPWASFLRQYHLGDVVRGTVRTLTARGVFVRIQAGIDGFIPLSELATWPINKPDDLLWIGDQVETVITRCLPARKKIDLSIRARLEQQTRALDLFDQLAQPGPQLENHLAPTLDIEDRDELFESMTREQVGRVLVVNDHDEVRSSLTKWLQDRGYIVGQAASLPEATERLIEQNPRAVLIDLHLLEYDALDLIRHIQRSDHHPPIGLMSDPNSLGERASDIEAAGVAEVFAKPLDVNEIDRFLQRIGRGERLSAWQARSTPIVVQAPIVRDMFALDQTADSMPCRLSVILTNLLSATHAQSAVIFAVDAVSGAISILAQAGDVRLNLAELYGVRDSPVGDVIRTGQAFFENHATEQARAKFSNLLDVLAFQSCLGVPIETQGEIRHAAFFFHPAPDVFNAFRLRDAQAGSFLLAAVLETAALQERAQSLNPMLLSGQLSAGFAHEVFNKITGLEIYVRNLMSAQDRQQDTQPISFEIMNVVLDLKNVVSDFQSLARVNESQATFDVNAIVQRAERLQRPVARKERVKISLKLAPDLPFVMGNNLSLQQVFLNLMLNATQHMALKPDGLRHLEINTRLSRDNPHTIQVRFTDSGPGIHRQLWDRIFTAGFSTRSGSGLGLFIARSFCRLWADTFELRIVLSHWERLFWLSCR